jgi:hypothetical protein
MTRLRDDYWNPFSQSERKEILKNDRDTRDTFHSRAQAALDDESGGRFAKVTPRNVTGASPSAQYPRQPENSPYASNPVPPGAAIDEVGYGINAVEPVEERPPPDPDDSLVHAVSVEGDGQGRGLVEASPQLNRHATPSSSPETARRREGGSSPWPPSQPSSRFQRRF